MSKMIVFIGIDKAFLISDSNKKTGRKSPAFCKRSIKDEEQD
ncbi:hypothetical protein THIOSC13_160078 [uncultured Thiomicrorhabdus sp.]|jgi:hypothetical protein